MISSATIFLLFKGLTRLQANHEIIFDLAESLHVTQEGTRYVFYLGEHYWSDGKEISALDFELSWKAILNPDFPSFSAHLFYPIKNAERAKKGEISIEKIGVHAENSKTLVVELERPISYFLELTSFCSFFPVPSHSEVQFSLPPKESFVCSGPFHLASWQPGKEILFRKNPLTHSRFSIFLEKIQIRIIPDEKQAFSLFEQGELDWVGEPFSPLPLNYLPTFSEKWESQPIGGITLCFFNTRQFPFYNQKLRQAFAYAIQREKILRKLYIPHASSATGLVPPILKGNRKKMFFCDEDTVLAQKLFQEGLQELKRSPKRLRISFTFEASELGVQIAKCLQKCWEEAFDIRILLEPLEFKVFYDRLSRQQHVLSLTQWMAQYNSPMNILERFKDRESGKNFSCWENQEYRHLLDLYFKQTNGEKRYDLVERAEELLIKQMPIAPIYYFSFSYLKKPYLKSLLFSPIGRVYLEQAFFEVQEQEEEKKSLHDHYLIVLSYTPLIYANLLVV
jgi:oligopeptide transport system substrate-binding protein